MSEQVAEAIPFWTNEKPRLHLRSWEGEGLPLLLTHGMGGTTHWWDSTVPHLLSDFKPAALDFLGHGDSGWKDDGRYDMEGFGANIEEARHALGWDRFVLCGHSMGARAAIEYARRHPERLLCVIAIDFIPGAFADDPTFSRARKRPQPFYPDKTPLIEKFRLQPRETTLAAEGLQELASHGVKKTPQGWTWKFDWRVFGFTSGSMWEFAKDIRVPTLIVRGEKSTILSAEEMARLGREIPGAKILEIPGAYHHTPLDAPRAVADGIKNFVASCAPSAK